MLGRYLGLAGQIISPSGLLLEPVLPGSSIVALALRKGLEKAKEVARTASDEMERSVELAKQSLPKVKEEMRASLNNYVSKKKKLLLIVIDDIDRLSPEEIRLVFQMIRVNADFPGLVFLLLYDESFVVRALSKYFKKDSRQFLEKIVQFQLGLPVMLENQIRDHVISELSKMFSPRPAYQRLLNPERLQSLWALGLGDYVKNLRHASRLLSSFQFHLGVFKSEEAEINPIDLFALETLRLFEPTVYRSVQKSADRLFPVWIFTSMRDGTPDPWKVALDEMATGGTDQIKRPALALLTELFPHSSARNAPFGPSQESQQFARDRRVCHILYFNRYFRLTIDDDDIPDQRITELERLLEEPPQFVTHLRTLAAERKLSLALTKLLARDSLRSSAKPVEMIAALCDFGEDQSNSTGPSHHIRISNAVHRLIELQLPGDLPSQDRFDRLAAGISRSNAVHIPAEIAQSEDETEHQFAETKDRENRDTEPHLTKAEVDKLNDLVADRLDQCIHQGKVRLSPRWVQSFGWYLHFLDKRATKQADLLLSSPTMVALMLCVVINDQAVEHYSRMQEHVAQPALSTVKSCLGIERFDKALEKNEAAIAQMDQNMPQRLAIYRDVRARLSRLADRSIASTDEHHNVSPPAPE
jgi:hypothetical protein